MNFILIQIVIFCLIIEISSFTGVFTNFRRRSRKHIDQRIIKGSSELPSHLPSTFEQDEDNINYLAHKHKATLRLVRNNPFLTPRDNKKLERFSSGIIHEKELETGLDVINSLDLLKDLNFTIFNATQRPVLDKLVTTFFLQRKQEHLILKFMATLNRLKYTYKFMNENHKENMLRLFQHIPYPTLFPISYAEMVFLMSNLQIPWKFVSEESKKTILLTMHELQSLFDQIDRISIIFHYGKLEIPLAEEQPWRRAASTYSTQQSNSQQSNLLSNMSEKERNEVLLSFLGLITKSVSNLEREPILENQARSISNIIYGLAYTGFRKTDFPREFNEKLLQFVEVTWDRMTFAGQCMTLFGLARMHQNWFQFPKSLQMKFEATFLKELPQTDFESFTMFLKTFSQLRYSWTQNPLLSEQIYARIGKYYCSHQSSSSSSSSSLSGNSIQAQTQTTVNPLFMSDFLSYLDLSKQQHSFYKSKENYKFLLQSGKLNRYRDHPWFLLPNSLQQTILTSLTGDLFDSNIHGKSGNRNVLAFKKKDSPFDKLLVSPMEQSTDQQNVTTVTTTTTTRTTTTAVEVAKITTTTTTTTTTTISSPIFATNPVDQENPNNLAVGHFQNLKAIWPLLPITVQEQFIQQIKQLKAFPALSGNQLGKFFDELLSFKISWRFLTKEFQESVFQSIYKYDYDLFPGYIGRILTAFANLGATGKDIPKEILECFSQSLENKKSLCQNSGFRQIIQGFSLLEYKWDDIPDRIRNILPELSKSLKNNCTADDLSYCMHGLAVLSFDSKELKESHSNSWKNSSLMALHQIIIENAFDCFPSNSTTKPLSEVALEVLSRWKGYFELIYSLPESIQEYLFHSINNNHWNISNAAKIIQLIENALYETPQSTTTHPDYFSFYRRNSRKINDDDANEDQREQEESYLSRLLRPPPRPRLTQRHLNTERFRVSRTHEQFSNYLQSFLNFVHNQRQQPPQQQQEEEDEGRELFLAKSPRRKQKDRHSHKYPPTSTTTTRKWFGMKNEFLGFSNYFYPMDIAVFFDPPPPSSFSSSFDQNKSYYRNPLRKLVAFIEINGDSHYLKQTQDEEEELGQQQPQQPQQQKRGEELLRRVDYFKEYLYSIYYPSIPLIRIDVKDLAFPRDFPEFSESSLSLFSFFLDEKEMKLKELCQGIYETILNKSLSSQYDDQQQR